MSYAETLFELLDNMEPELNGRLGTWGYVGRLLFKNGPRLVWHLLQRDGEPIPDTTLAVGLEDSMGKEGEDVRITWSFSTKPGGLPQTAMGFTMRVSGNREADAVLFCEHMDAVQDLIAHSLLKNPHQIYTGTPARDKLLAALSGAVSNVEEPAKEPVNPKAHFRNVLGSNDVNAIIRVAQRTKLSNDDKLDLYRRSQDLKSNKLANFVKSLKLESRLLDTLVSTLLDDRK